MIRVFTKWRESYALMSFQRSRFHARRHSCLLEVTTVKSGRTAARVERRRSTPEGGFDLVAAKAWPAVTPETVATAQLWCEQQADIATGNAAQ